MIYLITGVPGSGKTLYAVSTLLQKLMSEKLKAKDGTPIERRLVVDGIPDLALSHELMCERPDSVAVDGSGKGPVIQPLSSDEHGLWNWFEWCKPGDIIVCDEVQRHWRPRGMGIKPPREIAALETHRHLGIDFILITQNPMLLDQNVRRLVGRHQHVRRIFGMARAIIYEWDGCSADVHRVATATKSIWRFPKSAYALYKSAELHTRQRFKLPAWLAVPALAIVGGVIIAPRLWATASGVGSGRGVPTSRVSVAPVASVASAASAPAPVALVASSPGPVALAASAPAQVGIDAVVGCAIFAGQRRCYDHQGFRVDADDVVLDRYLGFAVDKPDAPVPLDTVASSDDVDLVAWVHRIPVSPPVAFWRGLHYVK